MYLVEDEEDIIERYRADEVEKEPRAQVMTGYQFRIEDNLFRVVLMHYTWREGRKEEKASGRVWHCVNEIVIMNERNEGRKEGSQSINGKSYYTAQKGE